MPTLTTDNFATSRGLGDLIAAAEDARLALHGFTPTTHACYTRAGCRLTFSRRRALAACAAEARLGVDFFARDQVGEGEEQAGEQGSAGVHSPGVRTLATTVQSP